MTDATLSSDGSILTVFVPLTFRQRSGRKLIIAPPGSPEPVWSPAPPKADSTLVKALARAHRWKKLLDTKQYATIKELAEVEQVHESYVGNLLRLTLLAPDIIEAVLDGRLPKGVGLAQFMEPWPGIWEEQRAHLQNLGQR
ncbi:Bacteriophage-related protein [Azospirillaceae bacterium]